MIKKLAAALILLAAAAPAFAVSGVTLYDGATNYMQLKSPPNYNAPYTLIAPLAMPTTGQAWVVSAVAGGTATYSAQYTGQLLAMTSAQFRISTPTAVSQMYGCTGCATPACISTGIVAAGSYSSIASTSTACR